MEFIKTKEENGVLSIILNRPDKFNSFNRQMALEVQEQLDLAASQKQIRAVLISGEGKAFCAGQDLAEAMDEQGPDIKKIVEEHYNPIINKIRSLEKPVVAAVNGVAAGAGANIALACDVVLAGKSASFIQAFSKIGLIPDSGGTYFLPRLIGLQRASALMMLGDKVDAEEAKAMGMVYQCYDDAELMNAASKTASKLASMPTIGIGLTKRLLNQTFDNTLEDQLHREGEMQVKAANTYDYAEGVKAFLEKRKPEFKGE